LPIPNLTIINIDGFSDAFGAIVASPAVGEKGRMDVRVEVTAPGGHSSVPPAHTGIGILSALLVELENNPIPAHIGRATPLYGTLQCYGAHAPGLGRSVKREIRRSLHSDKALHKVEDYFFTQNPRIAAQGGTTTAVDLIGGGVKTNALPELSWAVINHRISTSSSISELTERDTDVFKSVVEKFNMTYTAFGETVRKGSEVVKMNVDDAFHDPLEPAPVSPTAGDEAEAYKLLSGTIKSTYSVHRGVGGDNIVVAPGLSTGNTDTRYYWNLSRNIFRYNHKNGVNATELSGVHTVNESKSLSVWL
jgi:Gly-Xaa carboxypeptidase